MLYLSITGLYLFHETGLSPHFLPSAQPAEERQERVLELLGAMHEAKEKRKNWNMLPEGEEYEIGQFGALSQKSS
jgi:hypothetical protein